MIIRGGNVLNGQTGRFEQTSLTVENGRIAAFADGDGEVFDANGLYVLPGMIDTHIHGFAGEEFAKADGDFGKAPLVLAKDGVTAIAATVRCMPFDDVLAALRNVASLVGTKTGGAKIAGIHSEGPFVAEARRGAMHPTAMECTVNAVEQMAKAANGHLKLMTIAPERENTDEVIPAAQALGISCSMGHTDATYEEAKAAADVGATRVTHVFNAMRPLSHRETGILGEALTDDRLTCELIADFVHLDPAAVKLVIRTKGAERITLISDAGMMSGLPDGEYVVSGHTRYVKDGRCIDYQGRIAGSCFSMLKGAQNLRALGVSLEDIAVMAAKNPAKALGIDGETGSVEIGKCADLIVCDEQFHIHAVFVDGVLVTE